MKYKYSVLVSENHITQCEICGFMDSEDNVYSRYGHNVDWRNYNQITKSDRKICVKCIEKLEESDASFALGLEAVVR